MNSTDKTIASIIIGVVLLILIALVVGNTLGWSYHNEMLTIVGSETSEEGFEEFLENMELDGA